MVSGEAEFRGELLASVAERVGSNHYGASRRESGATKAERMVVEGLGRLGWAEQELRRRRKGDKKKVRLARQLREQTTMSLAWIAERLQMGRWTYVSSLLQASSTK
jgi:hypothetical protein